MKGVNSATARNLDDSLCEQETGTVVSRVPRGRDALVASLAILLSLFAGLSAYAAKPAHFVGSLTSSVGQGIIFPIKGRANLTYEARVAWTARGFKRPGQVSPGAVDVNGSGLAIIVR